MTRWRSLRRPAQVAAGDDGADGGGGREGHGPFSVLRTMLPDWVMRDSGSLGPLSSADDCKAVWRRGCQGVGAPAQPPMGVSMHLGYMHLG